MLPNVGEKARLYHRGKWSMIKNPLYNTQLTYAATQRQSWRQMLQEYNQIWGTLGPAVSPANYTGILVYIYSYTGDKRAPEYLIRIASLGNDEIMYAHDFPDLLAVLTLLAPVVSSGIFSDAYMQGHKNR